MVTALGFAFAALSSILAVIACFFWWRAQAYQIDPKTIREWQYVDQPSTIDSQFDDCPPLEEAAGILNAPPEAVPERVRAIDRKVRSLESDVSSLRQRWAETWIDLQTQNVLPEEFAVVSSVIGEGNHDDTMALAKVASARYGLVLLAVGNADKSFAVGVTENLRETFDAREIAERIAEGAGGGSGGNAAVATGGGKDGERLRATTDKIHGEISGQLSNLSKTDSYTVPDDC